MEKVLWYKEEAHFFEEALPIGNGKLGAMIYGGRECEHLSLNYDELWSGSGVNEVRRGAFAVYQKAQQLVLEGKPKEAQELLEQGFTCGWDDMYLPMGDLYLDGLKKQGEYLRKLDLEEAVCEVHVGDRRRTFFCSRPQQALYIRLEQEPDFELRLVSKLKSRARRISNGFILEGECPDEMMNSLQNVLGAEICEYGGKGIRFAVLVTLETDGDTTWVQTVENDLKGSRKEEAGRLRVQNAGYAVITLSVVSSYGMPEFFEKDGIFPEPAPFESAYKEHIQEFSSYFNRVDLCLAEQPSTEDTSTRLQKGEPEIGLVELLFHYGRYLVLSSSRSGSLATNLQGIWNEKLYAPWNSNYTLNINTEMNYWPVLMCNLPECYQPMINLVKKLSISGKSVARQMYHARGFAVHHNSDLWGKATPVGERTSGSARYAFWTGAVGWLCRHLYEYYEYMEDMDYLRNVAYPIMKEAALFYLDILIPWNGRMIISPATSPENTYIKDGCRLCLAPFTTMAQTIVQDLFENCISCCNLLGEDELFAEELKKIIPMLMPFQVGSEGQLLEWDKEYQEDDSHHRHVSHLYGLFPGNQISVGRTQDLAEACKRTLERRGDEGTGWSLAWKANLWAKLKDGDHALRLIKRQLALVTGGDSITFHGGTYLNMLDAHPPFQIDGNFGVTAAITQFLLQCEDNEIQLLPALPGEMSKGSVRGLLAKGGIVVDIQWDQGKAVKASFLAKTDKTVRIIINGKPKVFCLKGGEKMEWNEQLD